MCVLWPVWYQLIGEVHQFSSVQLVVGEIAFATACMVPLFKGRDDKYECAGFSSISLLSVIVW